MSCRCYSTINLPRYAPPLLLLLFQTRGRPSFGGIQLSNPFDSRSARPPTKASIVESHESLESRNSWVGEWWGE